jgi:hypothetical protein
LATSGVVALDLDNDEFPSGVECEKIGPIARLVEARELARDDQQILPKQRGLLLEPFLDVPQLTRTETGKRRGLTVTGLPSIPPVSRNRRRCSLGVLIHTVCRVSGSNRLDVGGESRVIEK